MKREHIGILTSLGFLLCRNCQDHPQPRHGDLTKPIIGCSGRLVYPGDTYSDEVCDVCGEPLGEKVCSRQS